MVVESSVFARLTKTVGKAIEALGRLPVLLADRTYEEAQRTVVALGRAILLAVNTSHANSRDYMSVIDAIDEALSSSPCCS